MSKRISHEKAKELRERELELQRMQKDGVELPKSDRRQKKYLQMIRRQKGYFAFLAKRYRMHGHDKKVVEKYEQLSK